MIAGSNDYDCRLLHLFIALDNRSYGKRLSGRSLGYLVERLAKGAAVEKRMSPHRVRHSSITAYLDLSDGNVRECKIVERTCEVRNFGDL